MITVEDIIQKRFSRSVLGYDIGEVDLFLDAVIEQFEAYERERADLMRAMDSLLKELEQFDAVMEGVTEYNRARGLSPFPEEDIAASEEFGEPEERPEAAEGEQAEAEPTEGAPAAAEADTAVDAPLEPEEHTAENAPKKPLSRSFGKPGEWASSWREQLRGARPETSAKSEATEAEIMDEEEETEPVEQTESAEPKAAMPEEPPRDGWEADHDRNAENAE